MKKKIWAIGLALAAAFTLTACGSSDSGNATGGSAAGEEAAGSEVASGSGETKEFTIHATNFDFDVKEIRVKKGDTLKITLVNDEGLHAVKFDGYNQEVKADETITFVADQTGEFQYYCSIFCGSGHADMVGKLIVE